MEGKIDRWDEDLERISLIGQMHSWVDSDAEGPMSAWGNRAKEVAD